MKLPHKIRIRRYEKKVVYDEIYIRNGDSFKYWNYILQKNLICANTEQQLWATIRILCEMWEDKERIFFEITEVAERDKNLKGREKALFLGAKEMLEYMQLSANSKQ